MIRSQSYHKLNRKLSTSTEQNSEPKRKQSVQKLRTRSSTAALGNIEDAKADVKTKDKEKVKGRKKDALEKFIESPQALLSTSLQQLRHTILCESLSEECPYRAYIWSILLRASPVESEWYSGVVSRGEVNGGNIGFGGDSGYDHVGEKIRNDVFRTFQNDKTFWSKVSEGEFIRVLNVFAWCVIQDTIGTDIDPSSGDIIISPYVQGMNVIAGPFLYICKSEPQSFTLFYNLLMVHMPRYITPNLNGTMDGVKLVDLVLQSVDPKLSEFLQSNMSSAKIYALPSILTLCACTPPLDQLVKLWDFLFSYGIHMNIIFVVAQLLLIRTELIESKSPMSLLRQFPPLNSEKIIKLSLSITKHIPNDLYDLIVRHPFDDTVTTLIDNYK